MRSETKMATNALPLLALGVAALFLMSKGDDGEEAISSGSDLASDPSALGYSEMKQLSQVTGNDDMDPDKVPLSDLILEFQLIQDIETTGVFDAATAAELNRVLAEHSPQ